MNAPDPVLAATKPAFRWDDPLLLEEQLTEEERMVRDTARRFAQERLLPRIKEAFRHEQSDPAVFREMGALDLLGIVIPEQVAQLPLQVALSVDVVGEDQQTGGVPRCIRLPEAGAEVGAQERLQQLDAGIG